MNYQNTMLTIIAFCLIISTTQNISFIPEAKASVKNPYGFLPVNEDGSINVRIIDQEIDVSITDIETRDELNVNIDEVGGGWIRHGGPLPVEIED